MITIKDVRKMYGNLCALTIDCLEIQDGQMIGLIGANGAGKTTLLKAISGLLRLEGNILFDDIQNDIELHEKVIFITEEFSFFNGLSIKAHADFLSDFYRQFDRERFFKLLEFFELPMHRKPRSLSRGQKAKLEIAIGFSKGGKYLLLDEPFLGNDVFTRRNFLRLMADSLKADETIVIATHLLDEIENLIDRGIILYKGQVAYDVMIDDIREQGESLEDLIKKTFDYEENRFAEMFYGEN
ncbi:MAG: hypothetical protein BGN88_11280 [Clostridiales bacterium 43-6]|nr:MAG: hypothetical protein BGN88_11280 [Clostridiales bacterium 43-6]